MKFDREVRVTWTNWTFGGWWDRTKLHAAGVDFGPFEIVWKTPKDVVRKNRIEELQAKREKLGGRLTDPVESSEPVLRVYDGEKWATVYEMRNRKLVRRDRSGFKQDLENLKADQERMREDWPL